jgi:hypothetical protein
MHVLQKSLFVTEYDMSYAFNELHFHSKCLCVTLTENIEPISTQGRTEGGGGLSGCSPLQPPKTEIRKTQVSLDTMISKVLVNLPFIQNQPLKLADD